MMIKESGWSKTPEEVRNFPAAHVMLAGEFDSAKKTIHVEKLRSRVVQNTRQIAICRLTGQLSRKAPFLQVFLFCFSICPVQPPKRIPQIVRRLQLE